MLLVMSSDTSTGAGPQLEHWLDALAEIGVAVGGEEPVADVLDRVARTACTLLSYDFCAVFLPDDHGRALTIVGSHGLSPEYVAQVNANRPILLDLRGEREAPSSVAFRTGDVVKLEDIAVVPDFTWSGVAQEQGYRALISAPMRRGETTVGVLNGYRAEPHGFDRAEITLVKTLATQVAIALGTAQLRAQEQATIRELRRAEEVHRLLTATALRGEGVSGVARALAELLDRPVRIRDVYDEALGSARWADNGGPRESHAVADVVLEGASVAQIQIAAQQDELSALEIRAVEHAATVTALELLRARTAAEVEQRLRGSLVADLLAADDAGMAALLVRARRLGWNLSGGQTLIAIRCPESRRSDGRPATERILAAADRFVAAAKPRPLSAVYRGDVILVVPSSSAHRRASAGSAVELASQLVEALTTTGTAEQALAAVSPELTAHELRGAFRTLRGALDLAGDRPDSAVIDLNEITVDHLLLQLDDPDRLRQFALSVLGRAIEYDEARSTELLRTARVLLDHGLDRQATAAMLHLHPNTVAQRIRRLEELTGLRLSRPGDLLQLTAALTVSRIASLG